MNTRRPFRLICQRGMYKHPWIEVEAWGERHEASMESRQELQERQSASNVFESRLLSTLERMCHPRTQQQCSLKGVGGALQHMAVGQY